MKVALCLLIYNLGVLTIGPMVLTRLTARTPAPRFGIAVWLTATISVLVCWPTAVTVLVVEVAGHTTGDDLITSCLRRLVAVLAGHSGVPALVIGWVVTTTLVAWGVATTARFGVVVYRSRRRARDHARTARIIGYRAGADLVVLPAAEPAAYCVDGRPSTIVVTTAAIDALDSAQLAAVMAHERAHLHGRHNTLTTLLRGLATVVPRVRLFRCAAEQVSMLLELCADDTAARRYGREPLLGGLLALSGVTPRAGLAAAAVGVLDRIARLHAAPDPAMALRSRAVLGSTAVAIAAGPVVIAMLTLSGILLCTV